MILAYVLSFLGMLAWQWGVRAEMGGAGKLLGVVFAVIALWKTFSELGGRYADRKELLTHLGIHAAIWVAGMFLYKYIMGLITIVCVIIGIGVFGSIFGSPDGKSGSSDRENGSRESAGGNGLGALPGILYSEGNHQWTKRYSRGDHVVYGDKDGNEITIRHAEINGGSIMTDQGFFQSY